MAKNKAPPTNEDSDHDLNEDALLLLAHRITTLAYNQTDNEVIAQDIQNAGLRLSDGILHSMNNSTTDITYDKFLESKEYNIVKDDNFVGLLLEYQKMVKE